MKRNRKIDSGDPRNYRKHISGETLYSVGATIICVGLLLIMFSVTKPMMDHYSKEVKDHQASLDMGKGSNLDNSQINK